MASSNTASLMSRKLVWVATWGALCSVVQGDVVTLKNGTELSGTVVNVAGLNLVTAQQNNQGPIATAPYYMIDDGVRRYFVFRKQVTQSVADDRLAGLVSYKLKHERGPRTRGPVSVGPFGSVEPFDQFGRRVVTLRTKRGNEPIIQGITELRPDYAVVDSLTHVWEYRIDTKTLPAAVIAAVMAQAGDRNSPMERRAAVQFYLQAEMFNEAQQELAEIRRLFPEMQDWSAELERQVFELKARRGINEIERRRDAGQHQLAYLIAKKFPEDQVGADVLRQAREICDEYEQALADRDRVLMLLDLLQANIEGEDASRLRSIRAVIAAELNYETIGRLDPFLASDEDDGLNPRQKLALACSGWLLGADAALVDLDEAIRLWDARFLVLEYLRTDKDPRRDREILEDLRKIESLNVPRLAKLVGLLPPSLERPVGDPSQIMLTAAVAASGESEVRYSLMLPPEYNEHHRYPLLVVLRGEGRSYDDELRWWAGDESQPGWAQRRGYVVIAPHYAAADATAYLGTDVEHSIVLKSIEHVRKRVRIDSDRVFLAGHGMGADACFDIAMSHPGWFAGVIPITGVCDKAGRWYWKNTPELPWYVVAGQLDRNTLDQNASVINNMMRAGQDVLYCEFQNRGYESYHEEQERIFRWMQPLRRAPVKDFREIEALSLRKSDNTFHWLQGTGLADRHFPPISWDADSKKTPVKFSGVIRPGRSIYIRHPGERTVLRLNPDLVEFNERWQVTVNNRLLYNDTLIASMESLLSSLRDSGDRERLCWLRLEL